MSDVQTTDITLTPAAAEAVREMLVKRDLEDYALRVFISGGGCSGYQYGMSLEANLRDEDLVMEQHGVKVVVDEISMTYLKGASIDYVDEVMGSGFKIENPNATGTCGCGNSFQTEAQETSSGNGGCCG
jgi:iron-sulfur cluster assembly protein